MSASNHKFETPMKEGRKSDADLIDHIIQELSRLTLLRQPASGSGRPLAEAADSRGHGSWLQVCCTQLKAKNEFELSYPITSERVEFDECIADIQAQLTSLRDKVKSKDKEIRRRAKQVNELQQIIGSQ